MIYGIHAYVQSHTIVDVASPWHNVHRGFDGASTTMAFAYNQWLQSMGIVGTKTSGKLI